MGAVRPLPEFAIAHSAHLGGMAAGWVYFRFVHDARWRRGGRASHDLTHELATADDDADDSPEAAPARDLRAEVDRILDKINSHGFGSLTPQEKRVLDEAKDSLSRR
jgi:hypothetical protein